MACSFPEPLEARIAPATLVNPTTVIFQDFDGDDVTLKLSKPLFDVVTLDAVLKFNTGGANDGVGAKQQLQLIDLTALGTPADANGLGIAITAKRHATNGGDGFVNAGWINGPGIALGVVKIAGDLGQIDAGIVGAGAVAVASLDVQSMGEYGTSTQAAGGDLVSTLAGGLGKLVVKGSLRETFLDVNEGGIGSVRVSGSILGGGAANSGRLEADSIGAVKIGGDLRGGAGMGSGVIFSGGTIGGVTLGGSVIGDGVESGRIESTGDLGAVKIARDLRGGAGDRSGVIASGGKLASVTLGGSLFGGDGNYDEQVPSGPEGQIYSRSEMGPVKIARDVFGGAGGESGGIDCEGKLASVTIGGSVFGAGGVESAGLSAVEMGAVKIKGSVRGGIGELSASILSDTVIGSVTIGGSLIGDGEGSALIEAIGELGPVKIGLDLIGGEGSDAGQVFSPTEITAVTIGGSVRGGGDASSGGIFSGGLMGPVKIGGDLVGGAGENSGAVEANDRLASITIGGSVFSGSGEFSGSIMSDDDIVSVTIKGSIFGTAANPVIISGEDATTPTEKANVALGKVSIGGSVHFAELRAGYDDNVLEEPGAQIGAVKIGGDWVASIIVASVDPVDAFFGNEDDEALLGAPDGLFSRIGSIVIKGQLRGTVGGTDSFGFVAQEIGSVKIGSVKIALTSGPGNDNENSALPELLLLGATGDFRVREIPLVA